MKKKVVAIYARQSVEKKDSVSIETQIDEASKGLKSFKVFADKGYSGKDTSRPEFQKMMTDIKNDLIGTVIVYKLDRISRNLLDFHQMYAEMKKHGCEIVSKTESFDTSSPLGKAMMNILAVFAEMERDNIVLRVKDNLSYRIKSGAWGAGVAPFGFENARIDGMASLRPVPSQLDVVKNIFKMYSGEKSVSIRSIQQTLVHTGTKSAKGYTLGTSSVRKILRCPLYAVADKNLYNYYQSKRYDFVNEKKDFDGSSCAYVLGEKEVYLVKGIKGIIPSRTFISVQKRLDENKSFSTSNRSTNKLQELSGLCKCGKCGYSMTITASPTLICNGRAKISVCDVSFAGLKLSSVQEAVAVEIQKRLSSFDAYRKEKQKEVVRVRKRIEKLEQQLANLIEIGKNSSSSLEAVSGEITKVQDELYDLQLRQNLGVNETDLLSDRLDFDALKLNSVDYNSLTVEEKQAVLRVLVEKISVFPDGSVSITWKDENF